MHKIHEKSSFEYCRADYLDTLQVQGRVILQIEQCERMDEKNETNGDCGNCLSSRI